MIGSGAGLARGTPAGLALHPVAGIIARLLVGALGDRHALHPDQQALAVHHREHAFETAVFLADAPADRPLVLAVGHDAGRRGMDAELFLDAAAARRSLRSPGAPSASGRNFGTRNSEMPRLPGGASGVRASTMWTMLSVRSWSP